MSNLLPLFLLLTILSVSYAQETLPNTTITAEETDSTTSIRNAEKVVSENPGAASLSPQSQWFGRAIKDADIFAINPSVSAESKGIGTDSRITIRGSGAQFDRINQGITILQDGVKATGVDGSFSALITDPQTIYFAEVFPGANGFPLGANQFGGAINYVLKNGLNSEGGQLQADYGSFETIRASLQYGGSEKQWDYFASYSYGSSDGYRDLQDWDRHFFFTSLGYQWSDSASTRLYFQLYDANAAFPGNLTEEQFKEDPTQRQLGFDDSSELVTSLYRTYLKTNWECGEDEYMIYGYYQYFDNNAFVQVNTPVGPFLDTADLILQEGGIGARGKTHWLPFGHSNILRSFIGADFGNYEYFAQQGPTFVKQDDTSENFQVYLENETILDERHHAFLGLGWIQTRRQTEQIESFPPRPDRDDKDDSGIWRVGYLYDLNEQSQLFANINQSFEAPSFTTLNASLTPLAPQKALTYELGTRFRHQWIKGSLTAYYAEVENEFIAFQDSLTGSYFYTNEDTTHQGIEAFLTVDLTEAWSSSSTYQLDLDMSYQLNDFTFDEGENSGNKLPGISPHVIASQLRLTAPTGKWNTALNLRYLPEGLVANNENTLRTDGFAVWGWAAEYIHNEHLSFYGGIDNLFDKNYANQVAINPITPSYINPGDGRAAYIGARLHW